MQTTEGSLSLEQRLELVYDEHQLIGTEVFRSVLTSGFGMPTRIVDVVRRPGIDDWPASVSEQSLTGVVKSHARTYVGRCGSKKS
jgi:hypothetical protein